MPKRREEKFNNILSKYRWGYKPNKKDDDEEENLCPGCRQPNGIHSNNCIAVD